MSTPRPKRSSPYSVCGNGNGNSCGCDCDCDSKCAQAQAQDKDNGNGGGGVSSVGVREDQGVMHAVNYLDFSSHICPESIKDMIANDPKFELGWLPVSLGSVVTEMEDLSSKISHSILIRRNIIRDNDDDERVYLSFGIDQGGGDDCGYDADKGVLKVNLRLLQMEEDELRETGGCFPLLLASRDESLTQHTHINEGVLAKAAIVHLHYSKESKEDPKPKPKVQVQTFLIDLHEPSLLRHGPTKFSINERQLLLNAAKVYAKDRDRGNKNDGDWYSKLSKYYFLSEHTGAEIEIRSPSMPILLRRTKTFEHLNNRTSTSNFLSLTSTKADGDGVNSWIGSEGGNSAKPRVKAKTKSCKKASFALDSDTSDDDGNQDEYEDDGFIVFGDEESSEDESENVESKDIYEDEDKDFCEVCHDGGNLLVCDGGPHMGGCGSAFHIDCIGKKEIPEGKITLWSMISPLSTFALAITLPIRIVVHWHSLKIH